MVVRAFLLVLFALSAACSDVSRPRAPRALPRRPSTTPTLSAVQPDAWRPDSPVTPPSDLTGPVWQRMPVRALPFPSVGIAALSGDEAVTTTLEGLYRVGGSGITPICDRQTPGASAVDADGDRIVAIGGDLDNPLVWRSNNRGAHCYGEHPPSLMSANARADQAMSIMVDGNTTVVWTPRTGGMVVSIDNGMNWLRTPDLPRTVSVFHARGFLVAVTLDEGHSDRAEAGAPLNLFTLSTTNGASWIPLSVRSPIHYPVAATRNEGDLLLLDPGGFVRVSARAALRIQGGVAILPHDPPIRRMASAGPGRFVVARGESLSALVGETLQPIANVQSDDEPDLDANAEGFVWYHTYRGVWRGRVGRQQWDAIAITPPPLDSPAQAAASGDRFAVITLAGNISTSWNGGRTWRTDRVPAIADPTLAVFDPAGRLLVIARRTPGQSAPIVAVDGESVTPFVPRDLAPQGSAGISPDLHITPSIGAFHDRWIAVDGGIFVTDDHGAHWSRRAVSGQSSTVVAAAFRDERFVVLDRAGGLWRSDDGAESFRSVGTARIPREWVDSDTYVEMTWNGDTAITFSADGHIARTINGGATWQHLEPALFDGQFNGALYLADGRLLLRMRADMVPGLTIQEAGSDRFGFSMDALTRDVQVIALDGFWIYAVSRVGALVRADVRRVVPSLGGGPMEMRFVEATSQ